MPYGFNLEKIYSTAYWKGAHRESPGIPVGLSAPVKKYIQNSPESE